MNNRDDWHKRYEVENQENWREIIKQIPYLEFPKGWQVRVLPPFGGAVARFWVKKPGMKGRASVYLDWLDKLGYVGEPYWEVYPYDEGVGRCLLNETDELIKMIKKSLRQISLAEKEL